MKNNYPIKYAVIPIKEECRYDKNEIIYYIVSKCFQTEKKTAYNPIGKEIVSHKVVFPYKHTNNSWVRIEPDYNIFEQTCTNAISTDKVFETFEEAWKIAKDENEKLTENYSETRKIYEALQEAIKNQTNDLVVGDESKEQTLIAFKEGNIEHINLSLYDYMNLYSNVNYVAYSINKEEFAALKDPNNFISKEMLNELSKKRLLENNPHEKRIKIFNEDENINNYYLSSGKMFYQGNSKKEMHSNPVTIIFTLESRKDVINSYIPRFSISKSISSPEAISIENTRKLVLEV